MRENKRLKVIKNILKNSKSTMSNFKELI